MNPLQYAALAAAAVAGAVLACGPAYLTGKSAGRAEIEAQAAKNALERMAEVDKRHENFASKSDRDRCIIFMRDSRLPISNCDER